MKKPTKEEIESSAHKIVPDVIDFNLKVLFCGINPGLYSAATGLHFARPGNRFWKTLFLSGFTDKLLSPEEELELLKSGIGITNIIKRASKAESDLAIEEFIKGKKILIDKLNKYKPQCLALVGVGAYKKAFNKPKAKTGIQDEMISNTKIWVLPNPSGLNANYKLEDFVRLYKELRMYIDKF